MKKDLPYGWTDDYALRFCLSQIERLNDRVEELTTELARLDRDKANRAGRKKATAHAKTARLETTQ